MPILRSAKKNLRKSDARRIINDKRRRTMREQVKAIVVTAKGKDATAARTMMARTMQAIDKAVKGGIIKKNTAARKKSRLSAMIKKAA